MPNVFKLFKMKDKKKYFLTSSYSHLIKWTVKTNSNTQ